MENLQLVLAGGKGNTTDLSIFLSASEHSLFVYLGLALMERVNSDPNQFAYKMLVGRLVNADIPLEELKRKFKHDSRTMKRWAEALKSNDPDLIVRAFAGRGCLPKLIGPMIRMVKMRYLQLRDTVRNYRQVIAGEVEQCFAVKVSRETLRRLFAVAREEKQAAEKDETAKHVCSPAENRSPAPAQSMSNDCHYIGNSSLAAPINDNHSPDFSLPKLVEQTVFSQDDSAVEVSPGKQCSIKLDGKNGSFNDLASEDKKRGKVDVFPCSERLPPLPPAKGLPYSGQVPSPHLCALHHCGQILFSPWMDLIRANRPQASGLQSQWISQILQGAVNIEQSHLICATSLSFFTGPIVTGLTAQRDHLKEMTGSEAVLDVYQANTRLLPDGPGIGHVFYYDPHTKECSTQLDMLKGWCGRRHSIAKVLHLDFIHTESGLPCFLQHYDNYYDLRERFFITLSLFGQLFANGSPAGSTFILDRGIFGSGVFTKFQEHGCSLITWEKGYQADGWDDNRSAVKFQRFRERNHAGDLKEYTFVYQESPWPKDVSIRRLIVRATNSTGRTIEVSILCTNIDMDGQQIITLIFNRWIQENNFKYLDRYFGLMQITSYASENYKDIARLLVDRLVNSPEYRELKRQFAKDEQALAKLLLKRERITNQHGTTQDQLQIVNQSLIDVQKFIDTLLDQLKTPNKSVKLIRLQDQIRELRRHQKSLKTRIEKFQKQLYTLEEEIHNKNHCLAKLDADLEHTLRQKSRVEILVAGCYQRPDIRKKAMMDALRITAHNIFQNMMRLFRPIYGNYRNDHVMLRMLTRTDGFIWSTPKDIQIRLWLKGRFQTHQKKTFQAFIDRINTFINAHFCGRAAAVNIECLDTTRELWSLTQNHGVHGVYPLNSKR